MALKPQICVTGKLVVCTTIRKRDAGRGLVLEGGGSVGPRHAAFEVEECPGGHAHAPAGTAGTDLGDCQGKEC